MTTLQTNLWMPRNVEKIPGIWEYSANQMPFKSVLSSSNYNQTYSSWYETFSFLKWTVFYFLFFKTHNDWNMCSYFQGIKSDVRTSSGMFLSPEERKYPMIQVGLLSSLLFNFCDFSMNRYSCLCWSRWYQMLVCFLWDAIHIVVVALLLWSLFVFF